MRKVSLQAAVTRLSLTLPTPVTRMCSTLSVVTGGSRSLETLFSEAALRPGLSGETQPCPQPRVRDGGEANIMALLLTF